MHKPPIDKPLIDKNAHIANRNRAFYHHRDFCFLYECIMELLTERLHDTAYHFTDGLMIDGFGSFSSDILRKNQLLANKNLDGNHKISTITQMESSFNFANDAIKQNMDKTIVADAEFMPFSPNSFDLVLSPFHLHWMNDLVGTLIQIKRILREDGAFFGVIAGGNSLRNLRDAMTQAELEIYGGVSPHFLPLVDVQIMGQLMQRAGFAMPVIDAEIVNVRYQSADKLFADLRYMGEGNALTARSRKPYGKKFFKRINELLQAQAQDGFFTISFELILLHGWHPSIKQRKPLKRGSGEVSLTDVL